MSTVNFRSQTSIRNYILAVQLEEGRHITAVNEGVQNQAKATFTTYYPPMLQFPSFTYIDNSWRIFSPTTFVRPSRAPAPASEKEKKEEEKKPSTGFILLCIAGVVAAAAAVGYTLQNFLRVNNVYKRTADVEKRAELVLLDTPLKRNFLELVHHKKAIDAIRAAKQRHYFASAVIFFGGMGSLTAGALHNIPWLMSVGKTTAVASLIWGTFNFFFRWNDQQDIAGHQIVILGSSDTKIKGLADVTCLKLLSYNEDMTPIEQPPPSFFFVPLYPQYYDSSWQASFAQPAPSAPPL